ncbi:MAG: T9SS type A sorting domain-containing protein [Bacteroidales bacterium]|nr:T9SS type A sorting domain-containing protein [Bacteroidales bacterium]
MTLNLSPLPVGIYYLTIKSTETTTRHKIIKVTK